MKQWSSLFGALGAVGILFGLVSVALLVMGAPIGTFAWIFGNFVGGGFFLVLWILSGFDRLRDRLASGEARRASRYGTSALVGTLASLVIVGLLGFLSTRYEKRFDWSEAKVHSLSDQSRKVLAQLDQDVEVVAFYPALEAPRVREVLDRYAYESPRFKVEFADPNARPDLVEKLGVGTGKLAEGVVRIAIGGESVELDEPTEEKITNALVKLTRTGAKKVYFTTGHGERPVLDEGAEEAEGFARAGEALKNENYAFEALLLAAKGEVPDDADVVVIAGPTRPFLPEEHRALERYVARGGALLVLVDPRAKTDLYDDLGRWGVAFGEDVVVDRVQGLFGRAATPFAAEYGSHPITEGLREVTMFHVVRSVKPTGDAGSFVDLVKTGPESWGETSLDAFFGEGRAELDAGDAKGPVTVAVAGSPPGASGDGKPAGADAEAAKAGGEAEPEGAEEKPEPAAETTPETKQARLVVFGDSDFATNQLIDAYRNRDLFVNSVNWLLGDVEAIAVRPEQSRASRLQLSNEQLSTIRYLSLFVLPEAIAIAGVWAWWSRRRAPGR
jgi:ABC-type uncharacterized transport system involved in gliding motility auxiliary subunit